MLLMYQFIPMLSPIYIIILLLVKSKTLGGPIEESLTTIGPFCNFFQIHRGPNPGNSPLFTIRMRALVNAIFWLNIVQGIAGPQIVIIITFISECVSCNMGNSKVALNVISLLSELSSNNSSSLL